MKKIILSVVLVFAFGLVNAQDKKVSSNGGQTAEGKWLIEANTGSWATGNTSFSLLSVDGGNTAWSVGLEGGYFVVKDLAIKAGLGNSFLDLNKLKSIAVENKWNNENWDLKSRLKEEVIIVTDVKLSIVFASHNIVKMSGYKPNEVLGKNPKMFQGYETDLVTSGEIRNAIQLQQPFEKTVLNYKKNGEVYACLIKGFPVFNLKGDLSHYIAFEKAA